jgi:hypothetical protein
MMSIEDILPEAHLSVYEILLLLNPMFILYILNFQ